jgi:hypothetical protein
LRPAHALRPGAPSPLPPHYRPGERAIKIGTQLGVVPVGGRGQGSYDKHGTFGKAVDSITEQVSQPPLDPVADRGAAHRA